jgi:tRNA (cmo5U34)-methyltransferase
MGSGQQLGSWRSEEFVSDWVSQDVLSNMLELPRRISAALTVDSGVDVTHVVDLGSGPGAYLDTFLGEYPGARGTWIDTSPRMEEVARERLARFGDRVSYRIGPIEAVDALELDTAEVVTTSRVVHHLSAEAIRDLYRKVHALVAPGGFFFNLDHYGSPEGWEPRYRRIRRQFTGPPKRDIPPHRHDFPFSPVPAHLEWLDGAGFRAPDVPWRTFYTALLAARRPA